MLIRITLLSITSGPCETPVNPVQLIWVAVALGMAVGETRAVLVAVKVASSVFVAASVTLGMLIEVGM